MGAYLLIILVLFSANLALMMGNYKLNNLKVTILSFAGAAIAFALMNLSGYLNHQLAFLMDNFCYLFLIIALIIFASAAYYIKRNNFKIPLYALLATFAVSAILFSSQASPDFMTMILYSLFVLIMLFVVYQLTKLLRHAKRQYPVIIGEYMSLFSILMFIFALTYNSTKALDYSVFSPFLILTPTYQLIYVIIGIIVVLVIGVLINDTRGK